MLTQTDFTQDQEIQSLVSEVRSYIERRRAEDPSFGYSDVFDGENWYVDLVQEGGGTLGVALVGYTYVMEQAGIRFLKLAGTSAGAINNLLMASAGPPSVARSEATIGHVAGLDLINLVDGDKDARKFIEVINNGGNMLKTGFRFVYIPSIIKHLN